jgi:hypothetical protein
MAGRTASRFPQSLTTKLYTKEKEECWSGQKPQREETSRNSYLSVDTRVTLKWILQKQGGEGVDYIHMAQDKVQTQTLVNTVKKLPIP